MVSIPCPMERRSFTFPIRHWDCGRIERDLSIDLIKRGRLGAGERGRIYPLKLITHNS
jgi:hypothetical protein